MRPKEVFKFLSLFGDGVSHGWFETIFLGVNYLKVHQYYFEKVFKICLSYNLVYRLYERSNWKDDKYCITKKGDLHLRSEQIRRHGDHDYYSQFDRTVASAEKLTPMNYKHKTMTEMQRQRRRG